MSDRTRTEYSFVEGEMINGGVIEDSSDGSSDVEVCSSGRNSSARKIENGIENGNSVGTASSSSGEESVSMPQVQEIQGTTEYVFYDYDDIFDELYVDFTSDHPIELPVRSGCSFWSPLLEDGTGDVKLIDSSDPDLTFFTSILPEIARMTSLQRLQFKQSVLRILHDVLYAKEEEEEDNDDDDDEDDEEEEEMEDIEVALDVQQEGEEREGEEEEEGGEEEEERGEGEERGEEGERGGEGEGGGGEVGGEEDEGGGEDEGEEDHAEKEVNNPREPEITLTVDTNVESGKETNKTGKT